METTIIDDAGDGRLHIVARAGAVSIYLRDTDKPGHVDPPEWLHEAGKVKSWADNKGGRRADVVRAALKDSGLFWEVRPLSRDVYGLAVYGPCQMQRRVTLAALAADFLSRV